MKSTHDILLHWKSESTCDPRFYISDHQLTCKVRSSWIDGNDMNGLTIPENQIQVDSSSKNEHSVTIAGLEKNQTYSYAISGSEDSANVTVDFDSL